MFRDQLQSKEAEKFREIYALFPALVVPASRPAVLFSVQECEYKGGEWAYTMTTTAQRPTSTRVLRTLAIAPPPLVALACLSLLGILMHKPESREGERVQVCGYASRHKGEDYANKGVSASQP